MNKDKKRYEVWGHDTFAYEDYFCRGFNRKSDALAYIKQAREKARTLCGDISLMDRFYLIENFSLDNNTPRCIPIDE